MTGRKAALAWQIMSISGNSGIDVYMGPVPVSKTKASEELPFFNE